MQRALTGVFGITGIAALTEVFALTGVVALTAAVLGIPGVAAAGKALIAAAGFFIAPFSVSS